MVWKEKGMFDVKEQRLLDQKWQIVTKKWFSDLELNEIKKKLMGVTEKCLTKMVVKILLGLVKKTMLCVKMSVMLCWRMFV